MKSKKYKYILVFLLMLIIGINWVYAADSCTELFGDPNDTNSLAKLINDILAIPRIIVPIIIIVLGMIDLAKASFAAKEDEMKKSKSTLIRRLFIGVAVFFIPNIVNVIMALADVIWSELGYYGCDLSNLIR